MKGNAACWFEIYVQDMERARTFYQAVFRVKLDRVGDGSLEMWAFPGDMSAYGTAGALVRMEGMASGGNSTLVYFACEDCAAEAARIPAAGGKVFKEKFSIGQYGFIVLATDTEGNMIGLHSQR